MTDELAVKMLRAIRAHAPLELAAIREAGEHGAAAGWAGFTYYRDTSAFYAANHELLWEALAAEADEFGYENVPAFVASFAMANMADTEYGFENIVAWWALETAGRWLSDRREARRASPWRQRRLPS